jgi:hypothetical protein
VGFNPPIILYFTANESIVVSAGRISYTVSGVRWLCTQQELGYTTECVESREVCTTFAGGIVGCRTECLKYKSTSYYQCVQEYTEWSRTYQLQAIELVDWDTGEVYASVNQTSLTFNINANTIVRFKYVLTSSWSRSWEVILLPKTPEPTPEECQRILNDPSKKGSWEWCQCTRIYDPKAYEETCLPNQGCLIVSVVPCCSGDTSSGCLNSWSADLEGASGTIKRCEQVPRGTTRKISISWSASWSLKSGWTLADIGKRGDANCDLGSKTDNSASGTCSVDAQSNKDYYVTVVVIFKKTQ